jgi:hypothetical protein
MRIASCLAVALLLVAGAAQGVVRHVPSVYGTIQAGVDAAAVGDTVMVAAGTYDDLFYPPGTDTTQCVVYMKSGITLLGAGAGLTTIDGLYTGRGIYCYGVTGSLIKGFTVTHAFAQNYAAGIYCFQGSSPTISDCEITECDDGGIICRIDSSPTITHCDLTDNVSKRGGGLAIENNCSPTVSYCTIVRNEAPLAGGVYIKTNSAPLFEHCVIDSNSLDTVNGTGGGLQAAASSQITLRNCSVNGNTATGPGGGLHFSDEVTAVIESTTVQYNTTGGEYAPGGGIYCEISDMDLDFCTISHNSAPDSNSDGGAMFLFFTSNTTITNCTIAENGTTTTPDSLGGGITCFAGASPAIENTIIAYNGPGRGLYCVDGTSTPIVSCSDIYGNYYSDALCGVDAGGNFSQDPLFCNSLTGNFGLHTGSPCLPGNHPTGAPCGLIGAHGESNCGTGAPEIGGADAAWSVFEPFAAPNPFRSYGTIHFGISRPTDVSLAVYDVRGRLVRVLLDERVLPAGEHRVNWDARDDGGHDVSSGVYFYRFGGDVPHRTGRLVLCR